MRIHANVLAIMMMAILLLSCNNNPSTEANAEKDSAAKTSSPNPSSSVINSTSASAGSSATSVGLTTKEAILLNKKLSFKNILFDVTVSDKIASQLITIKPIGISKQLDPIIVEVASVVTNTETSDLNKDGLPEILVYTKAGNAEYGSVVGYTVNIDETMSPIEFPELFTNPNAKAGYLGHDEFSIVNNVLTRKFPLYNPDDANSKAERKDRVITYKLVNGKKFKKLVINNILETPVQ